VTGGRPNAKYTVLDVDGPLPLDMIRGIRAIMHDPLRWLEQAVGRYGDLVAFPLPRTPVLLVNTPSGARRVLQENHRNYTKQTVQYGALSLVTGAGLLTSDGEGWLRHRRIMQPAFHHGGLDQVAGPSRAAAEQLRSIWDAAGPGVSVDADAATMRAMLEVVGRTLFAADLAESGAEVVDAVDQALAVVLSRAKSPLSNGPLGRLPTPSRRRLRRALATLDRVCEDVVRRRREQGIGAEDGDLLAVLLRATEWGAGPGAEVGSEPGAGSGSEPGAGAGMTAREVRDELVTLVIAGHETVASSLTWTLHLLAGAPDVQKQLHAELDEVLAGRAPDWSDLPALTYTRAVIDESLRLYPPAWVITRRAGEPDVIDGVKVPAGTLLLISPWLLHRRAENWPDPRHFDPARFLDPELGRRRPGYLPFGAGPRLCIGRDFALVEAALILAGLLRDRTVEHPPGAPEPEVDALVTLRPRHPLLLNLSPR
jgi:cytochrome P450